MTKLKHFPGKGVLRNAQLAGIKSIHRSASAPASPPDTSSSGLGQNITSVAMPSSFFPQQFPFPDKGTEVHMQHKNYLHVQLQRHGYRFGLSINSQSVAKFWSERQLVSVGNVESRQLLPDEALYILSIIEKEALPEIEQFSHQAMDIFRQNMPVNMFPHQKASVQASKEREPQQNQPPDDIMAFNRHGCRYVVPLVTPQLAEVSYLNSDSLVKTRRMRPEELAYARRTLMLELPTDKSLFYRDVFDQLDRKLAHDLPAPR